MTAQGQRNSSLFVIVWIAFSSAVILYNKYIFSTLHFKFPIFLTTWHMIFSSLGTQALRRWTTLLDDTKTIELTAEVWAKNILPIGVLFSLSLVFSNAAYMHLSVSFIQMLKATTPVAVMIFSAVILRKYPTTEKVLNILFIVFCVCVTVYGEVDFTMVGFLLQSAGILAESLRLVLVEKLMNANGLRLGPLSSLYYFAPVCAGFNILVFLIFEVSKITFDDLASIGIFVFVSNAAVAFGLNMALVFLIGKTSSLTLTLAGILKDLLLIGTSMLLFNSIVTVPQGIAYVLALLGLAYFKLGGNTGDSNTKPRFFLPKSVVAPLVTLALFFALALQAGFLYVGDSPAVLRPSLAPEPQLSKKKYFVRTVPYFTGGPEALMQLYMGMRDSGMDVYHDAVDGKQREMYMKIGMWTEYDDGRAFDGKFNATEDWTLIVPEVHECPTNGFRNLMWLLAVRDVRPCEYISHSYFISQIRRLPLKSTVVPYITPSIWNLTAPPPDKKENIIVLDNDCGVLPSIFEGLKMDFPDLQIFVAHGMAQSMLMDILGRSKVVIDGNIVGQERIILEGRALGSIAVCERRLVAEDPWDFEYMPADHTFSPGNMEELVAIVRNILSCYTCELEKTKGWIEIERNRAKDMVLAIKRYFASDELQFIINFSGGKGVPWATAVSALIMFPSATVDVKVPKSCQFIIPKNDKWIEYGISPRVTWTEIPEVPCSTAISPVPAKVLNVARRAIHVTDELVFITDHLEHVSVSQFWNGGWYELPNEQSDELGTFNFHELMKLQKVDMIARLGALCAHQLWLEMGGSSICERQRVHWEGFQLLSKKK